MIDKGEGDRVQKQQQRDNLREVIQYCENKVDCRRQLVLQYFGERFDKSQCNRTCDNCERARKVTMVDRTDYAIKALKLSEALPERHTLNQLVDMFKGSTAKRYASLQDIPFYGAAADLSKTEAERILQSMLTNQVFATMCKSNAHGFVTSYLKTGAKSKDLLNGRLRITLSVCEDDPAESNTRDSNKPKSTNKRVKTTTSTSAATNDSSDNSAYLDDEYDLEDSFINDYDIDVDGAVDLSHLDDHDEVDDVYASSEHELPERVPSPAAKVVNKLPSQYRQILDRGLERMVILDDDDEDDGEVVDRAAVDEKMNLMDVDNDDDDNDDNVQVVKVDSKAKSAALESTKITSTVPVDASSGNLSTPPIQSASTIQSAPAPTSLLSASLNTSSTSNPSHSNCYESLLAWRDSLAMTRKVNAAFILSNSVIGCIARNLPVSVDALAEIPGMTPERCEKYSTDILSITRRYK